MITRDQREKLLEELGELGFLQIGDLIAHLHKAQNDDDALNSTLPVDRDARFAPSLVTRSEVELFGLSMPRFALRVYFDNGKSFINCRRMDVFRSQIANYPSAFIKLPTEQILEPRIRRVVRDFELDRTYLDTKLQNIPTADCLLQPPPECDPESYSIILVPLYREYGEASEAFPIDHADERFARENSQGSPFVQTHDLGGGLCAQACCFMAATAMHRYVRGVHGLGDITAISSDAQHKHPVRHLIVAGMEDFDIQAYFQEFDSVGLGAMIQSFDPNELVESPVKPKQLESLRTEYEEAVSGYVKSGMPVLLLVDQSLMINDGSGKPSFYASNDFHVRNADSYLGQVRRHAVCVVGCSKKRTSKEDNAQSENRETLPPRFEFLIHDPSARPFMKADVDTLSKLGAPYSKLTQSAKEHQKAAQQYKFPKFISVTPRNVTIPLLRAVHTKDGVLGSSTRFTEHDIREPGKLAERLIALADRVESPELNTASEAIRTIEEQIRTGQSSEARLLEALRDNFNSLLRSIHLVDELPVEQIELRSITRNLLARERGTARVEDDEISRDRQRLNRLLIEDLFAKDFSRHVSGLIDQCDFFGPPTQVGERDFILTDLDRINSKEVTDRIKPFVSQSIVEESKEWIRMQTGWQIGHWIWLECGPSLMKIWDAEATLGADLSHAFVGHHDGEVFTSSNVDFSSNPRKDRDDEKNLKPAPPRFSTQDVTKKWDLREKLSLYPSVVTSFAAEGCKQAVKIWPDNCKWAEVYMCMKRDLLDYFPDIVNENPAWDAVRVLAECFERDAAQNQDLENESSSDEKENLAQRLAHQLAKRFGEKKIEISGFATFIPELVSHDESGLAAYAQKALLFLIETARHLDASTDDPFTIELVAGSRIDGLWRADLETHSQEEQEQAFVVNRLETDVSIRRLLERLKPLAEAAAKASGLRPIVLAVEPEPGPLYRLNNRDAVTRFCKELDKSGTPEMKRHIGLNLDVPHWEFLSDLSLQWLALPEQKYIQDRIVHTHISDHSKAHFGDHIIAEYSKSKRHSMKEFRKWLNLVDMLGRSQRTDEYPPFSRFVSAEKEACREKDWVKESVTRLAQLIEGTY